jgi:pSer/pThr/pTyr-binding forkhead associated (FHA) protein
VKSEVGTTQQIKPEEADKIPTSPLEAGMPNASNVWISLHMLDSGQILPISERTEFTMGRISDNQPIMPDIDFSSFKGYDNGVSRLHAVIRRNGGNVIVMDLGSSNGTYVNGTRLMPNMEQPLRHGDVVALGKLKMQVVLL